MLGSFLIGFAIGWIIGSVISICINVYYEYLNTRRAKELASEKTGKQITKLIVTDLKGNAEYGETIDARAFDSENNHVANITFNASKGSSLYSGQTIT